MGFLLPNLLFLVSFASIPVVIHLIQRIRLKRVQYSSLFFLTGTKRETFSWLKLKEILLLIFRTLFVFFLFFSLARPYLKKKLLLSNYEAARVIILDDSYSMSYNGNFNTAKTQVNKLLNELKKGSEAAILTTSRYVVTDLSTDLKWIQAELESVAVSKSSNTPEKVFEEAVNMLTNSSLPRKEIFIVTDLQKRAILPLINNLKSQKNKKFPNITVVNISGRSNENVGVEEIFISPNLPTPDFPSKPNVKIKNYSTKSVTRSLTFTLKYSERESLLQTVKTDVSLGPNESKTVPFEIDIAKPGIYKAEAVLSTDSLLVDNKRFFTITVPEQTPILLIFENPSDIQYIEKVLKLNFFDIVTANNKTLRQQNLKRYKAIGLFSPSSLTYADWQRLGYYLLEGGGLFIALDKEVKEVQWTNLLNINLNLHGKQIVTKTPEFMTIGQVNYENAVIEIFKDIDLSNAKFYSYWEVDSVPAAEVLAYFSSHKPFLIEAQEKKVICALTSFNIDNTDFMFKATFLPLIHRIFKYLSFPLLSQTYRIDDTITMQVETSSPVKITTPKGEVIQVPSIQPGKLLIKLSDTKEPGFYSIGKENFVVNVLAAEGDLARVSESEIKNQNIRLIDDVGSKEADLTKVSLSLAILFFILELVLLIL
jgi:hypothetical protein